MNETQSHLLDQLQRGLAGAGFDYQALLDIIARTLADFIGDACSIRIPSEDQRHVPIAAFAHRDPDAEALVRELSASATDNVDESLPGRVALMKEPVLVPVVSESDLQANVPPAFEQYNQVYGVSSQISVPLMGHGKVIGVISLSRVRDQPSYTQEDFTFVQDVADRAALAIENARLYAEKTDAIRLNEAIYEITTLLNSTLDYTMVMQRVFEMSTKFIGAESSFLIMLEEGAWVVRYTCNFPFDVVGRAFSDDEASLGAIAAQTRQPVIVDDTSIDDRVNRFMQEQYGIRSVMVFPLILSDQVLGSIHFNYHTTIVKFSRAEIDFGQRLASSISTAINTARLFEENRKSIEKIREQSNYVRSLIEASLDPFATIDSEGRITDVNEATEQVTGYSRTELIGSDFSDYFTDPEQARTGYQLAFTQGSVRDYPLAIRHRSGKIIDVSYNATVFRNEKGEIQGVFTDARDMTRRNEYEQQIRRQAELLDNAHDSITLRDLDNRILYWNKGSERLYGWTSEEAIGKVSHELLFKEGPYTQAFEALDAVKSKGTWRGEMRHVDRDGNEVVVDTRWALVYDPNGQPESILVINSDITEKKRLESQLLRAQRLESIGTLAGGLAHDLNNILTPIMVSLGLLRYKVADEDSQDILSMLESNVSRGAALIRQVLSFARGVEGERQPVHIDELIGDLYKTISETFPRAIEIETYIAPDILDVLGDGTQLHQVLMNLCINAKDAMEDAGKLRIKADNVLFDENSVRMDINAKIGPYVCITVQDTGTGIPPSIMDRIFEPFFTTKKPGVGTGLGLPTSLGIVKSHGGFFQVESEVGQGATFKVYLPAIQSAEGLETVPSDEGLSRGQGEMILIVDDEEPIRQVTKAILEENGYSTIDAKNGSEAVTVFRQHKGIELVLIDMMMPVMDGQTCIRALREIDPGVKIVGVSGLIRNEKRMNTKVAANAFITKPYTAEQLLKTIKQVITGT